MKLGRIYIIPLALAGLAISAGCSNLAPSWLGKSEPAAQPFAAASETVLEEVRLNEGLDVGLVADQAGARITDDMKFRAAEAGAAEAAVDLQLTTVGDLKARKQFTHSYLSDDTQVVLATSEGRFEVEDAAGGAAPKRVYGRMTGMFDPVTGETLGFGYRP